MQGRAPISPALCRTRLRGARSRRDPRLARPVLLRASMKDLLLVAVTVAFFTLSWAYAGSLDRL